MELIREVILRPSNDIKFIFNPGAIKYKNKIYLLPRVVRTSKLKKYISEIWLAESKDGINFELLRPIIEPKEKYERYGCEDARVTKIGDEYFITYTALSYKAFSGKGYRIGLASTRDFKKIIKYGLIGPNRNDKNCVIFPEKINGKIALLHRIKSDIYLVYFNNIEQLKRNYDEKFWKEYLENSKKYLILRKKFRWESKKIGAGAPPIKTKKGWLLIYHGVDEKRVYRVSAVLLDLNNPQKIIAQLPKPILEPKLYYEKVGYMRNVIFPVGAITKNNYLFIYYGGADKYCCLARGRHT